MRNLKENDKSAALIDESVTGCRGGNAVYRKELMRRKETNWLRVSGQEPEDGQHVEWL